MHINFTNLLNERNEQIVSELREKYDAKLLNRLDRRVILGVDKDKVLDCVGRLKK